MCVDQMLSVRIPVRFSWRYAFIHYSQVIRLIDKFNVNDVFLVHWDRYKWKCDMHMEIEITKSVCMQYTCLRKYITRPTKRGASGISRQCTGRSTWTSLQSDLKVHCPLVCEIELHWLISGQIRSDCVDAQVNLELYCSDIFEGIFSRVASYTHVYQM